MSTHGTAVPDAGATLPIDDRDRGIARKVAWRLAPLLMICYFVAFLDRVNVSFAALSMNADLGFDSAVFGLGSGIFFIGYFFFEAPSNLVLENRDRGEPCGSSPPTPPYIRVRIRRFDGSSCLVGREGS
jgi:hypothetical protein